MNDMTIDEVLDRAADVIAERGLHKGSYQAYDLDESAIKMCSLGTINYVVSEGKSAYPLALRSEDIGRADEAGNALGRHLIRTGRVNFGSKFTAAADVVPIWNDSEERTQDEVIEAFRMAAKEYREEHQK